MTVTLTLLDEYRRPLEEELGTTTAELALDKDGMIRNTTPVRWTAVKRATPAWLAIRSTPARIGGGTQILAVTRITYLIQLRENDTYNIDVGTITIDPWPEAFQ